MEAGQLLKHRHSMLALPAAGQIRGVGSESLSQLVLPSSSLPSGKYCTMGTTVPEAARPLRITNPTVLADVCLSLGGPRQLFNRAATVFCEFLCSAGCLTVQMDRACCLSKQA